MATRDRIEEIIEVRGRQGRTHTLLTVWKIEELRRLWSKRKEWPIEISDFVVIRLVTLLEVFARQWIAELIDYGSPFIDNAAHLVKSTSLKFDYPLTLAVHGKKVSIGELVAHSISTNRLEQIVGSLSAVLGSDLLPAIAHTHDRVAVEIHKEKAVPIISDIDDVRAAIGQLFDTRHIVVHELPSVPPYVPEDVDRFLDAALAFSHATDESLNHLLHGDYPLTQADMNRSAYSELKDAERELHEVYEAVAPLVDAGLLRRSQEAWDTYRKLQSDLRSGITQDAPGSIAPFLHAKEMTEITRERTRQLRWWLDREEGDL